MSHRSLSAAILLALPVAMTALPARAQQPFITLSSTTSIENSGLFEHLVPIFEDETGIAMRVVAQGTGQALETARRGDADVVLVHAREQEEAFVAQGHGLQRFEVMYNDFVIVGPADDPANLRAAPGAAAALAAIAAAQLPFVSRGDDSGTHVAEMTLWGAAGIEPAGRWYLSTGSGMGTTLNIASELGAHALTDRSTWTTFRNPGPLEILFQGDPVLVNPYGVILVNPERHPHVQAEGGQTFIDWILSAPGQQAIAGFAPGGVPVFTPSARRDAAVTE